MKQKMIREALQSLAWLLTAWVLWSREAPDTSQPWLSLGYKALAVVVIAIVAFEIASILYFWRRDRQLDELRSQG